VAALPHPAPPRGLRFDDSNGGEASGKAGVTENVFRPAAAWPLVRADWIVAGDFPLALGTTMSMGHVAALFG
jgi:hypothetical protein